MLLAFGGRRLSRTGRGSRASPPGIFGAGGAFGLKERQSMERTETCGHCRRAAEESIQIIQLYRIRGKMAVDARSRRYAPTPIHRASRREHSARFVGSASEPLPGLAEPFAGLGNLADAALLLHQPR